MDFLFEESARSFPAVFLWKPKSAWMGRKFLVRTENLQMDFWSGVTIKE